MNGNCVIVNANIAFKCLLSGRGDLRERIGPGERRFFSPRFLFVELFKHKQRLETASGLSEPDLLDALYTLVNQLEFIDETSIPIGTWIEAYRLCRPVDEKDTAYIALTFHLDGRFWTEDNQLKIALKARGFVRFFEPK